MALEPVPGVARLVIVGTMSSVEWANVMHWMKTPNTPFTTTEITLLVQGFRAEYVEWFKPLISNDVLIGEASGVDLSSDLGVGHVTPGSDLGGITGAQLTANVAQCITWRINRRYRGGHPRTYLPPPTMTQRTGANSWTQTHIDAMGVAANNFLASMGGLGTIAGNLVCVHRYRGKDPVTGKPIELVPPLTSQIVDGQFDSRIDSMRRRLGPDRGA